MTEAVTQTQTGPQPPPHTPIRPLWICRTDAQPWPCAQARLALADEYRGRPVDLCVYLGLSLARATRDLHQLNPPESPLPEALHARFIGWVPIRRRPRVSGRRSVGGIH